MSDGADVTRAVAAGLDPANAVLLAALRRRWWRDNRAPVSAGPDLQVSHACWPDLERALDAGAAPAFDEVFVAAMRKARRPAAARGRRV